MANRRMFSKAIVQSGTFITMPVSAQLLYFQLGMSADDDGYVEALPLMRMINANEQDLSVLNQNKFVEIYDKLVLLILDWKENNQIRKDRYTPSRYLNTFSKAISTIGIPNGNQMETQYSIGKVSIGKVRKVKESRGREATPEFLITLTEGDLNKVTQKYNVSTTEATRKGEELYQWLKSKRGIEGKYKDFNLLWQRTLAKDFGYREMRDDTEFDNNKLPAYLQEKYKRK